MPRRGGCCGSGSAGGAPRAVAAFGACWAVRGAMALWTGGALHAGRWAPVWLLPLRDLMSVCLVGASFAGNGVIWRGQPMRAGPAAPTLDQAPSIAAAASLVV